MEIKKILLPTDFSEGSSVATPYAADMAKRYGAKLHIVHVIYDVAKVSGWYVPHMSMDELYKDMETAAKKELDRCCIEDLKGFADVEYTVLRGSPSDEILKFASENKIDMIVMGSHGRKGFDRMLFGSTAEKVVRSAVCPVLTVRVPVK